MNAAISSIPIPRERLKPSARHAGGDVIIMPGMSLQLLHSAHDCSARPLILINRFKPVTT
jgi:hypothetical protein